MLAFSITKMKASLFLAVLGTAFLTGCANPFAQVYQNYSSQWPITLQQRLLPPSSEPRIISSSNLHEDGLKLEEQGLQPVGFAGFRGRLAGQQQLITQARKVGADVVLYSSEFFHTEQGVIPVTAYQPGQTYTTQTSGTATANAYGSGGYASGSGTYSGYSTTTTPGTYNTEYIPYQRQVFDQTAVFFRHVKPGVFGAKFAPIPDDLRTKLQRNTGALVIVVVENSPAFKANVMRGDVIIQIADKPVATAQELFDLLQSYVGQKIVFKVIRDTQTIEIPVQLNENL